MRRISVSEKRTSALYAAIHRAVTDARTDLKLWPYQDHRLAQVETQIWDAQQRILRGEEDGR